MSLSAGAIYAVRLLVIASTMPLMCGTPCLWDANLTPPLVASVSGLADLPATVEVDNLDGDYRMLYFRMF